jgi:hypothetical protein
MSVLFLFLREASFANGVSSTLSDKSKTSSMSIFLAAGDLYGTGTIWYGTGTGTVGKLDMSTVPYGTVRKSNFLP